MLISSASGSLVSVLGTPLTSGDGVVFCITGLTEEVTSGVSGNGLLFIENVKT